MTQFAAFSMVFDTIKRLQHHRRGKYRDDNAYTLLEGNGLATLLQFQEFADDRIERT